MTRVLQLTTSEEIFFTQQIEALEDKGVECTVLTVPGMEAVDGSMAPGRGPIEYLRFFPMVRRELRRGDYDIIHANYGLTAPFAVTQFKLPVVLTLWGSDVKGVDRLITKSAAWRSDAVTVRSHQMKQLLGRDDAHVLPSGVDLERFRPLGRKGARERVGWGRGVKHVLFPYDPNYERKRYPLAKEIVDIVGGVFKKPIVLHTISGEPHDSMPWYYNAADAVLLTSRYEGSPNTVKEAMACNIPVVATDVGDVRKRLGGVNNSFVCSTKDKLVYGLDAVLKDGRRSNGRQAVASLSWQNTADRIISIYESVM